MREFPRLPDIQMDRTFSAGNDFPGPDRIMELCKDASEQIRDYLAGLGFNQAVLDKHRFETLILPYMFEARRIGDQRGQYRATNPIAGFYPDTE